MKEGMKSWFAEADMESFRLFGNTVPRNKTDWKGGIVLYDAMADEFYNVAFGTGDNLSEKDIDYGFDDYIMVERYKLDGTVGAAFVLTDAVDKGYIDEFTRGLKEVDGGQLLLKRSEWTDGDIRRFITTALDFAGYRADKAENLYKYIVYIASERT